MRATIFYVVGILLLGSNTSSDDSFVAKVSKTPENNIPRVCLDGTDLKISAELNVEDTQNISIHLLSVCYDSDVTIQLGEELRVSIQGVSSVIEYPLEPLHMKVNGYIREDNFFKETIWYSIYDFGQRKIVQTVRLYLNIPEKSHQEWPGLQFTRGKEDQKSDTYEVKFYSALEATDINHQKPTIVPGHDLLLIPQMGYGVDPDDLMIKGGAPQYLVAPHHLFNLPQQRCNDLGSRFMAAVNPSHQCNLATSKYFNLQPYNLWIRGQANTKFGKEDSIYLMSFGDLINMSSVASHQKVIFRSNQTINLELTLPFHKYINRNSHGIHHQGGIQPFFVQRRCTKWINGTFPCQLVNRFPCLRFKFVVDFVINAINKVKCSWGASFKGWIQSQRYVSLNPNEAFLIPRRGRANKGSLNHTSDREVHSGVQKTDGIKVMMSLKFVQPLKVYTENKGLCVTAIIIVLDCYILLKYLINFVSKMEESSFATGANKEGENIPKSIGGSNISECLTEVDAAGETEEYKLKNNRHVRFAKTDNVLHYYQMQSPDMIKTLTSNSSTFDIFLGSCDRMRFSLSFPDYMTEVRRARAFYRMGIMNINSIAMRDDLPFSWDIYHTGNFIRRRFSNQLQTPNFDSSGLPTPHLTSRFAVTTLANALTLLQDIYDVGCVQIKRLNKPAQKTLLTMDHDIYYAGNLP